MIDDGVYLLAAFAAGIILGAAYLHSLWIVLRRLPHARAPGLWLLGSAAGRIGLLLAAWYWVSAGRWDGLLACLAGFLVIRVVATRFVRARLQQPVVSQG